MTKQIHDIWKVKEGSKTIWKYQAPRGVLSFRTKKQAENWKNATIKK